MPFDFSFEPFEPDSHAEMRALVRDALRGWAPLAAGRRRRATLASLLWAMSGLLGGR